MKYFYYHIVRRPWLTILVLLAITSFFSFHLPHLSKDNSVDKMLPDGDPLLEYSREIESIFSSDEFLIVAIESPTPFVHSTVAKLVRMTDELESIPGVIEVVSPTNTKNVVGRVGVLSSETLIDEHNIPNSEIALNAYRQAIMSKNIFRGSIISHDASAFGLVLRLEKDPDKGAIVEGVQKIVDRERGPEEIYFSGSPAINIQVGRYMAADMGRFFPLVILIILSVYWCCFRSIRGTVLPMLSLFMAVIWTLGLMAVFKIPVSVIGTMLPTLLIAIGSSYSIYLLYQYYEHDSAERDKIAFMTEVLQRIGSTIFLAGIITVVGFASLMLNDTRILREFGLFTAFGVSASILISMTFLPAVLMLLPLPDKKKRRWVAWQPMSRLLLAISTFNARRKYLALIVPLCLIVVALVGFPRLYIETNAINFFKDDDIVRQTIGRISTKFGGTIPIRTIFDAKKDGGALEPETLRQIEAYQDYLKTFPQIGKTISIVDMIKDMNMAIHEGKAEYLRLPDTRDEAEQLLFYYSLSSKPDEFKSLINNSHSIAAVSTRLKQVDEHNVSLGTRGTWAIVKQLQNYINRIKIPGLQVTPTGRALNMVRTSDYIVNGLIKSMLAAVVSIFLISSLAFRSLVAGLFSILTVVVAMVLNFGVMGWLGIPLDIATTLISSIAVVGVDDSVFFMLRHRRIVRESEGRIEMATVDTINSAGPPIISTSLALILGFSALTVASFKPVVYFGSLTALSMFTSTIGSLFVLPAAISIMRPAFIFKD